LTLAKLAKHAKEEHGIRNPDPNSAKRFTAEHAEIAERKKYPDPIQLCLLGDLCG
jgi:hypothetical protein